MIPTFKTIGYRSFSHNKRCSNNNYHEIIDAAYHISEIRGKRNGSKSWYIRDDGADLTFYLENYVYEDDTIYIEANKGCSYLRPAEGKKAKIILPRLNRVVFDCEYYREPIVYYPGEWEQYILFYFAKKLFPHFFPRFTK